MPLKPENDWLSPSTEEQIKLILEGKCPHNKGWSFIAGYADERLYQCNECMARRFI